MRMHEYKRDLKPVILPGAYPMYSLYLTADTVNINLSASEA
jgi:hypothetical protein